MSHTYKVYSSTWKESVEDAAIIDACSPDWAAELWCGLMEENGNFIDGYPQNHRLILIDEDGVSYFRNVDTEFEPQYYIYKELEK